MYEEIHYYCRANADSTMRQLYVTDREQWRNWLSLNHAAEAGIWLIFYKKETSRPTIAYDAAVEEALCFGWIDSIIKKIDAAKYARKFTPRSEKSKWSQLNKKRANKMIKQGRMTEVGLAKIKAAKKTGLWAKDPRPQISLDIPPEFAKALARNKSAKENFRANASKIYEFSDSICGNRKKLTVALPQAPGFAAFRPTAR